jgi:F0F1-type ATP synthase delta subunit
MMLRSSRKEHELNKLNKISERLLQNHKESNQIMGIKTLLQYSEDEAERAHLLQKLMKILNSPPNPIVRVDSSSSEVFVHDSDEK